MLPVKYVHDIFFFFKQKKAYEMRISDWSSDVCATDLADVGCWRRSDACDGVRGSDGDLGVLRGLVVSASAHGARTACDRSRSEERRIGKECVSTVSTRC